MNIIEKLRNMGPNNFIITDGQLHLYPGGTYDMKTCHHTEKDVAILHLFGCYVQSLADFMASTGELREDYKAKEIMELARGLYNGRFKSIVEDYSLWKTQFNPGDYDIPAFLYKAEGWEDISWSNDVAPSFHNDTLGLRVWVHPTRADKREYPEDCRIVVERVRHEEGDTYLEFVNQEYECDTEEALVHFLSTLTK